MKMRKLTNQERTLIWRVANKLPESQRQQLCADLSKATARTEMQDGSRIMFDIEGYERPVYRGQHAFPVEMRMLDADNSQLSVVLHADENDRLFELEIIRWGDGDLKSPKWDTLTMY